MSFPNNNDFDIEQGHLGKSDSDGASNSNYDGDAPPTLAPSTNTNDHADAAVSNVAATRPGLESIDDDIGPPLPDDAEAIVSKPSSSSGALGGIEQIDDNVGPTLTPGMSNESTPHKKEGKAGPGGKVEIIEGDDMNIEPTPFAASINYDDSIAKKKAKQHATNNNSTRDEDSIVLPPHNELEDGVRLATFNSGNDPNRRGISDFGDQGGANNNDNDNDEEVGIGFGLTTNLNTTPDMNIEKEPSAHLVPHAVLVEDGDSEVYLAEHIPPELPWWKQGRTKVFALVVVIILAASAITIGVILSKSNKVSSQFVPIATTESPSTSLVPTSLPSSYPTLVSSSIPSSSPSFSPTECINKIVSSAQKIELQGVGDPQNPKVEVDGRNMVVAVRDGDWGDDTPSYIKFHKLSNDGEWQNFDTFRVDDLDNRYSVALSGKTAFVGFENANDYKGAVLVYEQNTFGGWDKVEDPFVFNGDVTPDRYFGQQVDIDGDLACVLEVDNTYLFHQNGTKWVQFDTIEGGKLCSISGDTIAVSDYAYPNYPELGEQGAREVILLYKYDKELKKVTLIQHPIPTDFFDAMDLSTDYLVYWDTGEYDSFVYHRDKTNQTFTFQEQLGITDPEVDYASVDDDVLVPDSALGLDNDVLVVNGVNATHIFSDQGESWLEAITLDQQYVTVRLSGRSLLAATDNEIYAYNIQDCTQPMPTQTPSSSPSLDPTSSSSPTTECFKNIESSVEKIGLQEVVDPQDPRVAVDGSNMIVVVRDGDRYDDNPYFIKFHTLAGNNGEWQMSNAFRIDDLDDLDRGDSVALSGNTAFVGFPYANDYKGVVLVYEKNTFGEWEEVEDPFVLDGNVPLNRFGNNVAADGDLACVVGGNGDNAYLFHREGNKWVQFDTIGYGDMCSISGDTIAVSVGQTIQIYKYNKEVNQVTLIPDPIPSGSIMSMDLSDDHIVYWNFWGNDESNAFVYHQGGVDQAFTFQQQLNITGEGGNQALVLDKDILVVSGDGQTHIFSEQGGSWIETITLDQEYEYLGLSGQRLLAALGSESEIHPYNIKGCTRASQHQ